MVNGTVVLAHFNGINHNSHLGARLKEVSVFGIFFYKQDVLFAHASVQVTVLYGTTSTVKTFTY